jgi:CTP:molybdopterin cytidylyltransferase MocA
MGGVKQLLELDGVPLLARTVNAVLGSGAHPVVVVLGANEDKIRASISGRPIIVAHNAGWSAGLSSSIQAGLSTILSADPGLCAVLLTPCDQPALSSEMIVRLAETHLSTGRIACSRYNGRNGSPAVFGREHFLALRGLSGDQGARDLLNGNQGKAEAIEIPSLGVDLDTPSDVGEWKRRVSTP